LLDLSDRLPSGRLKVGEAIVARMITVDNPDALRMDFTTGLYASPYPNAAPVVTSTAVTGAIAGQP
jgi:large repetitive protein